MISTIFMILIAVLIVVLILQFLNPTIENPRTRTLVNLIVWLIVLVWALSRLGVLGPLGL